MDYFYTTFVYIFPEENIIHIDTRRQVSILKLTSTPDYFQVALVRGIIGLNLCC
jgi:hypothetical protein